MCSHNGVYWGHIRSSMVSRHSHDHTSSLVTPATNIYNDTDKHKLQIHLPSLPHYISCSYCLGNIHCFWHALLLLLNYFGLCKGNWEYHRAQSCIHSHWCSNRTCSSNSAGIRKHTCSSGDYHACSNSSHACSNNSHMRQY